MRYRRDVSAHTDETREERDEKIGPRDPAPTRPPKARRENTMPPGAIRTTSHSHAVRILGADKSLTGRGVGDKSTLRPKHIRLLKQKEAQRERIRQQGKHSVSIIGAL